VAIGNLVCLAAPEFGVALAGRTFMGLGTGAGFVAGVDLVRGGGGRALGQGAYGGATMAGGGLAIMVVPALADPLGWRAPYWSGLALALAAGIPVLLCRSDTRARRETVRAPVAHDRRLLPLGAIQAATFGLAIVAGNWIVALLERLGAERSVAGAVGGLVLFAGIVTRPLGGWVVQHRPDRARAVVALSLVVGAAATFVVATGPPIAVAAPAALVVGLAAGLPFAAVFAAAQRLRPDAPAAAVGLVNGCAILAIVVLTPLAGLAFSAPGNGRLAFVAIAILWAASLAGLRKARL
jgi:predicted MFS family arabinose efflux permease